MHSLALRMGRTVKELDRTLDVGELAYWAAVNRRQPIGDERFDLLFANLCAVVCNVMIGAGLMKRRGGGFFKIEDFRMFPWKVEPEKVTPIDAMRSWLGARVVKGKPKRGRG